MVETPKSWWTRLGMPLRVGLVFAGLGLVLAVVGIGRGNVPLNPLSILLALLISAGGWGVVSWAIATAAADVENDIAADEAAGATAETAPDATPGDEGGRG